MIIIFVLLLFILGLLLNTVILNLIAKKFKAQNVSYKNAVKISFFEWLATGLIGIIIGLVISGLIGNILTWFLGFITFNLLCKKYYHTKIKTNISIYLILNLIIISISLIIIIPFRALIAQPFYVSGSAMSPFLNNKDYIIIKLFDKKYQRGDIIIHKDQTNGDTLFLKRIVGMPGEKIQIKNNKIYIYDGGYPAAQSLYEYYLPANVKTVAPNENFITLLENQYYVMGDNRENSKDSRFYGPINKNQIIGKYWLRLIKN